MVESQPARPVVQPLRWNDIAGASHVDMLVISKTSTDTINELARLIFDDVPHSKERAKVILDKYNAMREKIS